jgi:hypothetical protein
MGIRVVNAGGGVGLANALVPGYDEAITDNEDGTFTFDCIRKSESVTTSSTTTLDMDAAAGSHKEITVDENTTLEVENFGYGEDGLLPGKLARFVLIDDGVGGHSITWGSSFGTINWVERYEPTMPQEAGGILCVELLCTSIDVYGSPTFRGWTESHQRPANSPRASAAIGTAYRPSTTRDALVSASVQISTGVGGDGKIEMLCDSANPPTTVRGTFRVGTASTVLGGQLFVVVPAGHYWKLVSTTAAGTPTYSIVGDVQEVAY